MKIGNYVQYKSELFIICEIIGDKAKILSPTMGKRFVKMDNLTYTNKRPAKQVMYQGTQYLVTAMGTVISLATNRIMSRSWGNYKYVLREACWGSEPAHLREQAI